MDVRNCRQCGKMYNYIGGPYRSLCPNCVKVIEDKFIEVREFIRENRSATMAQICEECGVNAKQVEKWVREERLFFAEDSPIGLACEGCGKTIKTGRFCDACRGNMANQFDSAYKKPEVSVVKKDKEAARMRFLDN